MFEKEAEEYAENRDVCYLLDSISEDLQNYDYGAVAKYDIDPLSAECFKDGAEFGYEQGISRLRYCCTCKNWKECGVESMYGICADWEIKGE